MEVALIFVSFTHLWLEGRNTFVQICKYTAPDGTHHSFVQQPFTPCPLVRRLSK